VCVAVRSSKFWTFKSFESYYSDFKLSVESFRIARTPLLGWFDLLLEFLTLAIKSANLAMMLNVELSPSNMYCFPVRQEDESQGQTGGRSRDTTLPAESSSSTAHNRIRGRPMRKIQLNIPHFDVTGVVARWLTFVFDSCIGFFSAWHVSSQTVYRLSICALILHMTLTKAGSLLNRIDRRLPADNMSSVLVYYFTTCLTCVFSFSCLMVLWMKCYPTQAVVLTGVVTLFLVECLFPVTVVICLSLVLINIISFLEALIVSVSMLTVSAMSSWCIRTVLSASLGHG
jgi:hypothetical protein